MRAVGLGEQLVEKLVGNLTSTIVQEAEKTRIALSSAFADSLRGQRITGALARPLTANAQNYGAGGRLVGWSVRADTAAATINLYDGPAADPARYLGTIELAAGSSQTEWFGPGGISFVDGLYAEVTGTGVVTGSVWIGAVD